MEEETSETSVNVYQATRRYKPSSYLPPWESKCLICCWKLLESGYCKNSLANFLMWKYIQFSIISILPINLFPNKISVFRRREMLLALTASLSIRLFPFWPVQSYVWKNSNSRTHIFFVFFVLDFVGCKPYKSSIYRKVG